MGEFTEVELREKAVKSNKEFFEMFGLDADIRKHLTGFNIGDMVLVQILRVLKGMDESLEQIRLNTERE